MRIASPGHAVFAASTFVLGLLGFMNRDYAAFGHPISNFVPAHPLLGYFCAVYLMACGVGLLWRRTAITAARALFAYFLFWSLLVSLPDIIRVHASFGAWYNLAEPAVLLAAAWVLYAWFAPDWDRRHLRFVTGIQGVRAAQVLFGLAMIYFGLGHFVFLKATVADVPQWLPWPDLWAYFTGSTFIAAGGAIVIRVWAPLAAALSAVQIGLFFLLVWFPAIVRTGPISPFHWGETISTAALMVGAWMIADSYRVMLPLASNADSRHNL